MLWVWVWEGGVSNKEIERVYEYYKYGREIGYIEKRKSSVKEMRERNISKVSSDPAKDPAKDPSSEHSSEHSSDPAKDPSSEHSSDPAKDPSSDPAKDPSSDPAKDPSSEHSSKDLSTKIFTEEEQLKYIMPIEILKEMGIEKDWDEEVSYEWSYCDHFWEADVIVTRIPLNKKS